MTAKEKAKELVETFRKALESRNVESPYEAAKQCALIAVDEILKVAITYAGKDYEYYQQVKEEIEKL